MTQINVFCDRQSSSAGGSTITNPFFLANLFEKAFYGNVHTITFWRYPKTQLEAPLRLSKYKIEHLSDKIIQMLQEHPRMHPSDNVDLVTRAIDDAIFENMRAEEEIDDEVEALVAENKNEISAMDMDVGALRSQLKRELARKKGFLL